jgi:triacylglycerol lipase
MKLGLSPFLVASAIALVGCGSEAATDDAPVVDQVPAGEEAAPPAGGTASTTTSTGTSTSTTTSQKGGAPYPVVLLHGMSGFGTLEVGPVAITYFNGVVEDLTKSGEAVFVTLAPPYDTSEVRAAAIAKQIDLILQRTGKAKVNIIGHSQGGLDARVLASPNGLGYGDRIASVTTIATPHRGSKVADVSLGLMKVLPASVVDDVTGSFLEILQKSAYELQTDANLRAQVTLLSEEYMRDVFNVKYVNDSRVVYQSYGGRTNLRTGILECGDGIYPNDPADLDVAQGPLAVLAAFLEDGKMKVNDGLVTVESSRWGTFQQCVAADHLKEVGQIGALASSFDHRALFRDIVSRLRASSL